jgi:hypothetical protein
MNFIYGILVFLVIFAVPTLIIAVVSIKINPTPELDRELFGGDE